MAKQCVHYGCNEPVYYEGATLCEAHIRQENARYRIEGDNFVGRAVSYAGAAILAGGLLMAVILGVEGEVRNAVFALLGAIGSGMLLIGMGEAIRLLQKISDQ